MNTFFTTSSLELLLKRESKKLARLGCLSFLAIALLCSCDSIPEKHDPPEIKRICCRSFDQMEFDLLAIDQDRIVELTAENSPVFEFPDGRGVFKAFKLVDPPAVRKLWFKTYVKSIVRFSAASSQWALVPHFALLNENKELIQVAEPNVLVEGVEFFRGLHFEGVVDISESARFIVVYSAAAYKIPLIWHSENGSPHEVSVAHKGELSLRIDSRATR